MNNARRKRLADLYEQVIIIREMIEEITEEEQTAFDNLPESIQYSERGERMESIISNLEDITSDLDSAAEGLENYEEV